MVALRNTADHYIFVLWFLLSSFFSSPNLSRRRLDVYHTCTQLAGNAGPKKSPKSHDLRTIA